MEEWIGRRIDNPHVIKVYEPTRRRRFLYHITEYLKRHYTAAMDV
jgi:hypothetical protein